MIRSILNQVRGPLMQLNPTLISGYCTNAPIQRRIFREINQVKMVGTLISDSFELASGTKALTIRTVDSPSKHSNHNVHLKTKVDFLTGQRVYLTGKLRTKPIRTDDGKLLTSTVVKANQLFVLDNENATETLNDGGDQNKVELLANIASEIVIKDNHVTFAVATHYSKHNSEDGSTDATDATTFHRVFVHDEGSREFCQNKLKKTDRVLLNGRIGHMTYTGPDGKKLYSGFIVAENVYRVARRSSSHAELNETAENEQ